MHCPTPTRAVCPISVAWNEICALDPGLKGLAVLEGVSVGQGAGNKCRSIYRNIPSASGTSGILEMNKQQAKERTLRRENISKKPGQTSTEPVIRIRELYTGPDQSGARGSRPALHSLLDSSHGNPEWGINHRPVPFQGDPGRMKQSLH